MMAFLLLSFLQHKSFAQTVNELFADADADHTFIYTNRFGEEGSVRIAFNHDGTALFVMLDRYKTGDYFHGYQYVSLAGTPDYVVAFNAETGTPIVRMDKWQMYGSPLGKEIQTAFDRKCFLDTSEECREEWFNKSRSSFYNRQPDGWVDGNFRYLLNLRDSTCESRNFTLDTTFDISLVDENGKVKARISNLKLYRDDAEKQNIIDTIVKTDLGQVMRPPTLSGNKKKDEEALNKYSDTYRIHSSTRIVNTKSYYNPATNAGFIVFYIQSKYGNGEGLCRLFKLDFNKETYQALYTGNVFMRNSSFLDVLNDQYFIERTRSFKQYYASGSYAAECNKYPYEADTRIISLRGDHPGQWLNDSPWMNALVAYNGNTTYILEGVYNDTAVYSVRNDYRHYSFFFVNIKTNQVFRKTTFEKTNSDLARWWGDYCWSDDMTKMCFVQPYEASDNYFCSGMEVIDFSRNRVIRLDDFDWQLEQLKSERASAKAQADYEEAEYQRIQTENREAMEAWKREQEMKAYYSELMKGPVCDRCGGTGKISGYKAVYVGDKPDQQWVHVPKGELASGAFDYQETDVQCPKCLGTGHLIK